MVPYLLINGQHLSTHDTRDVLLRLLLPVHKYALHMFFQAGLCQQVERALELRAPLPRIPGYAAALRQEAKVLVIISHLSTPAAAWWVTKSQIVGALPEASLVQLGSMLTLRRVCFCRTPNRGMIWSILELIPNAAVMLCTFENLVSRNASPSNFTCDPCWNLAVAYPSDSCARCEAEEYAPSHPCCLCKHPLVLGKVIERVTARAGAIFSGTLTASTPMTAFDKPCLLSRKTETEWQRTIPIL